MVTNVPMELFEHFGSMKVILKTELLTPKEKVKQATEKLEVMFKLLGHEF